jgi:hypothetical protein
VHCTVLQPEERGDRATKCCNACIHQRHPPASHEVKHCSKARSLVYTANACCAGLRLVLLCLLR